MMSFSCDSMRAEVVFYCLLHNLDVSDMKLLKTSDGSGNNSQSETMSFIYLSDKAQKIATAIHLVTGLFEKDEPLRRILRNRSLDFLSFMRTFSHDNVRNEHVSSLLQTTAEEILSLLDIAYRSNLVSQMNRDVIVSEVNTVIIDTKRTFDGGQNKHALVSTFVEPMQLPEFVTKNSTEKTVKKFISKKPHSSPLRNSLNQESFAIKDIKDIKDKQSPFSNGKDRKDKIKDIIVNKGDVTIKDIASVMPEYSEKTIQRDLVEMVANSDIKKRGERRWTVYFL